MNKWLNEFLLAIETALQHGAALAIILGLLVSIGLTQYVKRLPFFPAKSWLIRSMAVPVGAVTTFFTWPIHELSAVRIFLALAVGAMAPLVYQAVVLLLYWKWPQLERHISAEFSEQPK